MTNKLELLFIIITFFNTLCLESQINRGEITKNTENYHFIINDTTVILHNNKKYGYGIKESGFKIIKGDSIISKHPENISIYNYSYNPKRQELYILDLEYLWSFNIRNYGMRKLFKIKEGKHVLGEERILYSKVIKRTSKDEKRDSLISKNLINNNNRPITKMNKILRKDVRIGEIIYFNSNNKVLISTGVKEAGGFLNPSYYLYNLNTHSLQSFKHDDNLNSVFDNNGVWVKFYNINKTYCFLNNSIIDSDFNFFSNYLGLYVDIQGFVFENNNLKRLVVYTETDEKDKFGDPGKSVLIQYKPSPHKERIMYRIYHNKILSRDKLERFDDFELRLFRNMIFAKYNYDFDDKFLTAYFNLYSFYKFKKESRTKDMDGKLTEADRKNLKLIQQLEQE